MWYNRLREMKKRSGLTTKEISERSGIPEPTLEKLFAGSTKDPKLETMKQLVHFLGYSLDDLYDSEVPLKTSNKKSSPIAVTGEHKDMIEKYNRLDGFGKSAVRSIIDIEAARMEAQQTQQEQFEDMKQNKVIRLFCYAQPVSAGTGARLDDDDGDMLEVVMNMETARADFCVKVTGHSMEPLYKHGDILLIHSQPDIEEGDEGIFLIDSEGYVKEKGPDCLISLNYNYPDVYPEEGKEIRCLGKVIGVLNPYDIIE